MDALLQLMTANNLLPHGHCLFWRPDLLLLHVVSDVLIALAYFSIPIALMVFIKRRKDLIFNHIFLLFASFILACGMTHLFNVADIWLAQYPLSGLMKAITAVISLITAVAVWKLLPAAVALPSPTQLRAEVRLREQAERKLRSANEDLEQRISHRTQELTQVNQELQMAMAKQQASQQQAEFLADVVKWSGDAIVRLDPEGTIMTWNSGAEALYGYKDSEALGKNISMMFADEKTPFSSIQKKLANGQSFSEETVRVDKQGNKIHIALTVSAIRNPDSNQVEGYASISRSVEERHRIEKAQQQSNKELMRVNDDLKDFVYIASHDLQEPLRLISSYLHILEEDYGDKFDEDGKRFMGYTLESAKRLNDLIGDLLGYSRLNTEDTPPHKLAVSTVIKQVLQDLSLRIQEKQATIEYSDDLPLIWGRENQIRLVFQNIIGNALKYSHAQRPPHIRVQAKDQAHQIHFTISDNGIGFDPKHADRIFQVFRRLHPNDQYQGTGIGLAICKKIIERHHGEIWAESTPDKGSQFHFTLPKNHNSP